MSSGDKKKLEEIKRQVLKARRYGFTKKRSAQAASISVASLTRLMAEDAVFAAEVNGLTLASAELRWVEAVENQVEGWQRFAWLLERKVWRIWGKKDASAQGNTRSVVIVQTPAALSSSRVKPSSENASD